MFTFGRYKPRNTLAQRFDPRSRIIFALCFMFSAFLFWDVRILAAFTLLALAAIIMAQIDWHETRRLWLTILGFVTFYAILTLLTSRAGIDMLKSERVILSVKAPFTIFSWQPALSISSEQAFYALSQFLRMAGIAIVTVLIPYTIDPALYGITFRRLGMPDKLAYALDLTMRFVPSLSRDFAMTIDAQKARGYELENREGGVLGQARKLAPLLVPVVIYSIVTGEEVTDAMDLRAFGTRPRTWLRELRYDWHDYALITFSVLMLLASVALRLLGYGSLWTP